MFYLSLGAWTPGPNNSRENFIIAFPVPIIIKRKMKDWKFNFIVWKTYLKVIFKATISFYDAYLKRSFYGCPIKDLVV